MTYRMLKWQFQLDDEALEDLKLELITGQRLAVDEEGTVLVWTGAPPAAEPGTRQQAEAERQLHTVFLAVMALYMLHSVWEYKNGRHVFRMAIARLVGVDKTMGDPNTFGATIVYTLPFLNFLWHHWGRGWKRLGVVGYFLIFSGARDVGFGTDIVGRWFDAAAHSQTDFFAVANGSPQRLAVRALVGGGVAVQIDGTWVATIASGANSVSAPPPWLSENANHDFTVVRSRRAYAVLPRGSGDPNAITMYSARGNLCGTVTFPVGGLTSGLDGSVIGASGKNGCTKTWWPGLLK